MPVQSKLFIDRPPTPKLFIFPAIQRPKLQVVLPATSPPKLQIVNDSPDGNAPNSPANIPRLTPSGHLPVDLTSGLVIWRNMASIGFTGYDVSTPGDVRNAITGRMLKRSKGTGGYPIACIKSDVGKKMQKSNHLLVALMFLVNDDPINKVTVDHINRNRDDPSAINLRWATWEEQRANQDTVKRKTHAGHPVYQIDTEDNIIKKWDKIKDANEFFGGRGWEISEVIKGKAPLAFGYKWSYCEWVDIIPGEIWWKVPYEEYSHIEASTEGRFRYENGMPIRGSLNAEGYVIISVRNKSGDPSSELAHVLIMATFVAINMDPMIVVNHLNGIKNDNRLRNLMYCTKSENSQHAYDTGLNSNKHTGIPSRAIPIVQMSMDGQVVAHYSSAIEASRIIGISATRIRYICDGKKLDTDGIRWAYAHEKIAI